MAAARRREEQREESTSLPVASGLQQNDDRGVEGAESPGTKPLLVSADKLRPSLFLVDSETRRKSPCSLEVGVFPSLLPSSIHLFFPSFSTEWLRAHCLRGPAGLSTRGCRRPGQLPRPQHLDDQTSTTSCPRPASC